MTLPYWWSGIDKLLHPNAALLELANARFGAPIIVLIALVITQLGGSLLIIVNRLTWLGAGALGVFTIIVTVMVHAFWQMDGPQRFAEMNTFLEHMALVAGFFFTAVAALRDIPSLSSSRSQRL